MTWIQIISNLVIVFACCAMGIVMWISLRGLGSRVDNKLDFVTWYELNEDELYIKFAETGEDREMDFNCEAACDREYEMYLNQ
ncbi:hypothetical protein LCGC14_1843520 [marine sediment metagenome]|uniref:Uncharacterized protein n=1 Tax=marine sediment metagenome TaxID=412755 RepID=A0A0F9H0S2_9ZZZZ